MSVRRHRGRRFRGPCGDYEITEAKAECLRALVLAGDKGLGGSLETPGATLAFLAQHGLGERIPPDRIGGLKWRATEEGRAVHHRLLG